MKIERETRRGYERYEFPLSEAEVEDVLKKLPEKDLEGLEKIVITPPLKNEDHKRYGRYVKGIIYLFKHQKQDGKFEIVVGGNEGTKKFTPGKFKIKNYEALLHEMGHHVGIKDFNDKSEDFADDYQDEKFLEHYSHLLK